MKRTAAIPAAVIALAVSACSTTTTVTSGLGTTSTRTGTTTISTNTSPPDQPATTGNKCNYRGAGVFVLPDPACTPGAPNPQVTASTIRQTICKAGWTKTIRPPESVTYKLKLAGMKAYGLTGSTSDYEEDHLIPLELGGAPADPRNLWPETDNTTIHGYVHNPKDKLEYKLRNLVCHGQLDLTAAQHAIATDWVAAYREYVK